MNNCIVSPGDRLGSINDLQSGLGTYTSRRSIYSSVLGQQTLEENSIIKVIPSVRVLPPVPGQTVLCRVTRVARRFVQCDVYIVDEPDAQPFFEPFRGQIKHTDVRRYDVGDVRECFRASDIIRAIVISSGDTRRGLLLSTEGTECGVVLATSELAQAPLIPISSQLMCCSATGRLELRKVAAPRVKLEGLLELGGFVSATKKTSKL